MSPFLDMSLGTLKSWLNRWRNYNCFDRSKIYIQKLRKNQEEN